MKKILALVMAFVLALSVAACSTSPASSTAASSAAASTADTSKAAAGGKVGISMPTQSLQRWNQDGSYMKEKFEAAGYTVDLQYAGDNDIPTQVSQIENMITGGCKILVIAAIDGTSLTEALKNAKSKNISVIAYDRLIMNSDAISYYASFDNYKVGQMQGQYIKDKLKLDTEKGPFNIEIFTGSPDDNNVNYFFGGAMDVLKPFIDSGKLVVLSGQKEKAQCATPAWKTENAQERMENIITSVGYGPKGKKLDAVLSSNDSVANGVTNALVNAGYTKDNFPILTGQDCDKPAMKNIIAGTQSMSIFKDTRTLAEKVVGMVNAIMKDTKPDVNNTKDYNNGIAVIPSFLCDPVYADASNYKKILIDSGYYKEADLQ